MITKFVCIKDTIGGEYLEILDLEIKMDKALKDIIAKESEQNFYL